MEFTLIFIIILIIIAVWYAWRYYSLRREINQYATRVRGQKIITEIKDLQNISSAISSLISAFDV
ncbi:MAG TPA: hypothetical protein VJM08_07570, partial [Anaerolineales bacterium]|nr:hypothetical protein [Anaerolineales bacterium]